jgi:trehalose/maltose hydrolase-like predicted phosphorylase
MFMLPFFNLALPELARNLVRYRVHTLPGARRKAAGLGHTGAFYAWESQESGDDACTLFNITDVITGRPLRTYFADKQVHISADVAHGIWQYYLATGDKSLIVDGGAEVLLECAKFFRSWARTAPGQAKYEIFDVTGPDEYHERVHNNAFSNGMALAAVEAALKAAEVLRRAKPAQYRRLIAKLGFSADLRELKDLAAHFYVPQPNPKTGVIEQFDGYHKLEDRRPADLKPRLLDPREYLGGGQGVATTTQVLKQADVVALLHVQGTRYSTAVKKANWEFYEPRTEHGSSLSACLYALVATAVGKADWAYKYFLKTATVDLRGDAKQYVGSLYIGGTHPAANGGAWMAAVLGFGGLALGEDGLSLAPRLPKAWKGLRFRVAYQGQRLTVSIKGRRVSVAADASNQRAVTLRLAGRRNVILPGRSAQAAV